MGKNDWANLLALVVGLLALVVGAILGYAIVKALFREKIPCPNCRNPIQKNVSQCPHCRVWLRW